MPVVFTIKGDKIVHVVDAMNMQDGTVWTLCGVKFDRPMVELGFGSCDLCCEKFDSFRQKSAN